MTSWASGGWPPGEVVMFVRSWKEGSQVAPLTKLLSIRRRACTTCCRSHEVVVEEIERVPAAAVGWHAQSVAMGVVPIDGSWSLPAFREYQPRGGKLRKGCDRIERSQPLITRAKRDCERSESLRPNGVNKVPGMGALRVSRDLTAS